MFIPWSQLSVGNKPQRKKKRPAKTRSTVTKRMTPVSELFSQALRHHQAGRMDKAVRVYKNVLAQDPESADAYNNLALCQAHLGKWDAAKANYQQAIALQSDYAQANNNLGVLYLQQQQHESALQALERAIQLAPNYHEAWRNQGLAQRGLKQNERAKASFEHALNLQPGFLDVYHDLAQLFQDLEEHEPAQLLCQRALQLLPEDPRLLCRLGAIYRAQGNHQQALDCGQRALLQAPKSIDAHDLIARAYARGGQMEQAIKQLKQAIPLAFARAQTQWQQEAISASVPAENKTEPAVISVSGQRKLLREGALPALVSARDILDRLGVAHFLCFGTLLGCIREQDFLHNDKDIDIGVWGELPLQQVIEAFEQQGFTLERSIFTRHSDPSTTVRLPFRYNNDTTLDLFIHTGDGERLYCGVEGDAGILQWWFSRFELIEYDFLGQRFMIPDNYKQYLREAYGAWEKPDPLFIGTFDVDNIVGGYPPVAAYSAHYIGCKMLLQGDFDKARKILSFLLEKNEGSKQLDLQRMLFIMERIAKNRNSNDRSTASISAP